MIETRGSRARRWALSLWTLLALWIPLSAVAAIDPDDLLPVDQAFALTATADGTDAITVTWKIADGYYLYRHRTSGQADAGFEAGALRLPAGEPHEDEFFGRVETYRERLRATLPGRPRAASTTLTVKYQGCADAGICYPPQTRTVTVPLPTGSAAPLVAFGNRGGAGAGMLLGGAGTGTPLPPEQAFGFEAIAGDDRTLLLRFSPAPGYYLYRDRTTLTLAGDKAITLGTPRWPAGTAHHDEHFGDVVVYFQPIDVPLPLRRKQSAATQVRLTANFQGCQTDGICYPPMTRTVEIALPAIATTTATARAVDEDAPRPDNAGAARGTDPVDNPDPAASGASDVAFDGARTADEGQATTGPAAAQPLADDAATPAAAGVAEDSRLAAALSGADRWLALASFLGFGLLLAFTPCVLPMIPILSGLIAGASAGHERGLGAGRALGLSLVYVLANALVFTVAGVVAGLAGANLQIAFQTPWVLVVFAALFVALALSSFGLFELQLPGALRARLGRLSDRQRGGSLAGVAVMGALSALIVGPCVAPPLAAAVLYIGQTRDPLFGGAALFLLAMGMGLPLLAFGVAAGKGLPTSGPWMVAVQRVFGFVFLGLAVWMLSRIVPGALTLALWGALLVAAAVTLALALRKPGGFSRLRVIGWTAAVLLAVVGIAQVIGALAGSHDPLRPLAGLRGGAAGQLAKLPFRPIKSVADLDREVAAAGAAGRPLMLDFYADWCVACKEMEKYTFPEPAVQQALADFVMLKADVTANDPDDQALMKRLGIIGPPATLFYVDGGERRDLRLFGFEPADAFSRRADRVDEAGR